MKSKCRKIALISAISIAPFLLTGCESPTSPDPDQDDQSLYSGIGIYPIGESWSKTRPLPVPAGKNKANLLDDDHVIVVIDKMTGEIRQCGNMSGYCTRLNPWQQPGTAFPQLPVNVSEHATRAASTSREEPAK